VGTVTVGFVARAGGGFGVVGIDASVEPAEGAATMPDAWDELPQPATATAAIRAGRAGISLLKFIRANEGSGLG
jgi:hypothetical protein